MMLKVMVALNQHCGPPMTTTHILTAPITSHSQAPLCGGTRVLGSKAFCNARPARPSVIARQQAGSAPTAAPAPNGGLHQGNIENMICGEVRSHLGTQQPRPQGLHGRQACKHTGIYVFMLSLRTLEPGSPLLASWPPTLPTPA